MQTIKLIIEYNGRVTLNGEYTTNVTAAKPLVMTWFAHNDLTIETEHEKIIFNTDTAGKDNSPFCKGACSNCTVAIGDGGFLIRPKAAPAELTIVASEQHTIFKNKLTIELAKGGNQFYMTINEENGTKYAFPLPSSFFE